MSAEELQNALAGALAYNEIDLVVKDGAYRLGKSVDNPGADRRAKRDWRKAQAFEPGVYYVCSTQTGFLRVEHVGSEYGLFISAVNVADFKPLLDALDPDCSLEEHLRFMERFHYVKPRDVILRLVEAGIVSENAVRAATKLQKDHEDTKED